MNIGWIALLALPVALLAFGLRRVPAQRGLNVRRFGRYQRTLGPGWHFTIPLLERAGHGVNLIGHHLQVDDASGTAGADLYYQIVDPEKAGETLDQVDDWVAGQAREALRDSGNSPAALKSELNRRVAPLGLRVIRCSMHLG